LTGINALVISPGGAQEENERKKDEISEGTGPGGVSKGGRDLLVN